MHHFKLLRYVLRKHGNGLSYFHVAGKHILSQAGDLTYACYFFQNACKFQVCAVSSGGAGKMSLHMRNLQNFRIFCQLPVMLSAHDGVNAALHVSSIMWTRNTSFLKECTRCLSETPNSAQNARRISTIRASNSNFVLSARALANNQFSTRHHVITSLQNVEQRVTQRIETAIVLRMDRAGKCGYNAFELTQV